MTPTLSTDKLEAILADGHDPGIAALKSMAQELLASRSTIEDLRRERDEARQIVRDIYWMALRYADGRKSYAVGMCNDAVQKGYDGGWLSDKSDGGDPITPRLARDGMSAEWVAITDRLEAAERELAIVNEGGWKLVPAEPTEAMLNAGEDAFVPSRTGTPIASPSEVYRAMLAAAPLPPAPALNGEQE